VQCGRPSISLIFSLRFFPIPTGRTFATVDDAPLPIVQAFSAKLAFVSEKRKELHSQ
jgi:hypothetical protein